MRRCRATGVSCDMPHSCHMERAIRSRESWTGLQPPCSSAHAASPRTSHNRTSTQKTVYVLALPPIHIQLCAADCSQACPLSHNTPSQPETRATRDGRTPGRLPALASRPPTPPPLRRKHLSPPAPLAHTKAEARARLRPLPRALRRARCRTRRAVAHATTQGIPSIPSRLPRTRVRPPLGLEWLATPQPRSPVILLMCHSTSAPKSNAPDDRSPRMQAAAPVRAGGSAPSIHGGQSRPQGPATRG